MTCCVCDENYVMASFECDQCGALVDISYGGATIAHSTPASELR
jgi:hypothetical protein